MSFFGCRIEYVLLCVSVSVFWSSSVGYEFFVLWLEFFGFLCDLHCASWFLGRLWCEVWICCWGDEGVGSRMELLGWVVDDIGFGPAFAVVV